MLASHAKWQHGAWQSTFAYGVKPAQYASIESNLIVVKHRFKYSVLLLTRCRWLIGTAIKHKCCFNVTDLSRVDRYNCLENQVLESDVRCRWTQYQKEEGILFQSYPNKVSLENSSESSVFQIFKNSLDAEGFKKEFSAIFLDSNTAA